MSGRRPAVFAHRAHRGASSAQASPRVLGQHSSGLQSRASVDSPAPQTSSGPAAAAPPAAGAAPGADRRAEQGHAAPGTPARPAGAAGAARPARACLATRAAGHRATATAIAAGAAGALATALGAEVEDQPLGFALAETDLDDLDVAERGWQLRRAAELLARAGGRLSAERLERRHLDVDAEAPSFLGSRAPPGWPRALRLALHVHAAPRISVPPAFTATRAATGTAPWLSSGTSSTSR